MRAYNVDEIDTMSPFFPFPPYPSLDDDNSKTDEISFFLIIWVFRAKAAYTIIE